MLNGDGDNDTGKMWYSYDSTYFTCAWANSEAKPWSDECAI